MSGPEVIGAISSVIAIIDASINVYDSAHKDLKLSETFKTVRSRLPILLDILNKCENDLQPIKDSLPADVCEGLENTLATCHETVGKLRAVFENVLPGPTDTWQQRYTKHAKRFGKGNKVEELMLRITKGIQLVVNHHAVKSTGPDQMRVLDDIIREMKSMQPSSDGEESSGMIFNSDGGAQTNNVNTGSGQQVNNNAAVGTQTFGKI